MSAASAPTSAARGSVRLTRRGRVIVVLFLLVLAAVVLSLGRGASSQAAGTAGPAPATRIVVVQPGQSLWSIAATIAPNTDPRETIARITDLNSLASSVLPAGKALLVPAPAV
ncbi:MAG: LysM peptidoglycan-binding domain-containing protein [Actinomycetes bacterium]